jgi:hypothetical protein
MPDRVKTSFIPKQSFETKRTSSVQGATIGVVNTLAGVVLIAAILAAGGLFFFEQYTKSAITSKRETLDRARAAFQPETIRELARLDTRLLVGSTLLSQHVAPSALFDFIERNTLASVRFGSFSYTESSPGRVVLAMDGEALSFNAVALQSDAFGASDLLSDVLFENLNINEVGNVTFRFSAVVNTSRLVYDVNRNAPSTIDTTPTPAAATSTEGVGETPSNEVAP